MNVNKGDVFEEILEFLCFNEGKFVFGEREIRVRISWFPQIMMQTNYYLRFLNVSWLFMIEYIT